MNQRDNLISLLKKKGYDHVPLHFELSPYLEKRFREELGVTDYWTFYDFPWRYVEGPLLKPDPDTYSPYFGDRLKDGTAIDIWGVGHEPGSEEAMHMSRLVHPLLGVEKESGIFNYPFPDFTLADISHMHAQSESIFEAGYLRLGRMGQTVWETAWAIRSMEDLMADMMLNENRAELVLDGVANASCARAEAFAKAPVDVLWIGDDIGMQSSIMMGEELYRKWLKPRTKRVIEAAKKIKPDILIMYHSCGYIEPFIPDLIEIGVDILNPVQPESMDFKKIHAEYGRDLAFHGTIGTQSTMPFGTPREVRETVHNNLDIAGPEGGLFCAPTHLLEPEVPLENILAYVEACREYTGA